MTVEFRETMRATNEGDFAPGNDPTNWQFEYNFNQGPVANGFSEADAGGLNSPLVTYNQGGPPANRGIVMTGRDPAERFNHLFQLISAPQLNPAVGCTGEFRCAVSPQSGYRYQAAGIEFTYVNGAGSLSVAETWVGLSVPGATPSYYEVDGLDNSAFLLYRLTIDAARVCRVYRDGSLILTSGVMAQVPTNGLRFMFWGEGGI